MNFVDYFKDWEYHHLANRADQFGLDSHRFLNQVGNKVKNNKALEYSEKQKLNQILHDISKIHKFKETCTREDCETCGKLHNLLRLELLDKGQKPETFRETKNEKWNLNLELWRWQKECKQKWWENNSVGIVKVITGAGKTIFALSLISQIKDMDIYQDYCLKIIVVVPNTALLKQWKKEFQDKLNLTKKEVGIYYGRKKDELSEKEVMIYVVNSARNSLELDLNKARQKQKFDTFLIADECHRYASSENSKIFNTTYTYKLGLSATPERQGDYGFENILVPNLGSVIYRYGYDEALNDGVISPYHLYRVSIDLDEDEKNQYDKMTEKANKMYRGITNKYPNLDTKNLIKSIGQLSKDTNDPLLERYTILLNKRKSIVHKSINRFHAIQWLIDEKINHDNKVLIFHERINHANRIFDYLRKNDFSVGIYHSKVKGNSKEDLNKFRNDDINVLVTCKALDEGFDLPKIDTGIIASATASIRQRIQRIGRILRRSPGKYHSTIYTIYVRGIEDDIFDTFELKDLKGASDKIRNFHLSFKD